MIEDINQNLVNEHKMDMLKIVVVQMLNKVYQQIHLDLIIMMVLQEENSKDLVRKNMQDYLHMSINPLEMKHLMVIFTEVLVVKHLMVALLLQLKKM